MKGEKYETVKVKIVEVEQAPIKEIRVRVIDPVMDQLVRAEFILYQYEKWEKSGQSGKLNFLPPIPKNIAKWEKKHPDIREKIRKEIWGR